jgi:hypothetical protein
MKTVANLGTVLACVAGLSACAPATEQVQLGAPESQTTLVVTNQNVSEMVIYALRGSMRTRLGSVAGMGTARFRVSDVSINGVGDLRIVADPVGSPRVYTTSVINVVPGARVELRLEESLQISSYSVR